LYHDAANGRSGLPVDFATDGAEATQGLYARHGKRALDLLLVLLSAPVALPVVLLLALLIRSEGGPALYGQPRVGRGGRLFTCWKLRTMVVDADARLSAYLSANPAAAREWDERQKLRVDPRVTRFGAMLRATSLDELPQLWNVLTGEMSLVGPRPFMPEQEELYPGRAYYAMRPGLTGFWQVGDRNDSSFAARAVHDARYAREISFGVDVATIMATVRVILRPTGC
jgi:exopolysaccharide production protein ExoY